MRLATFLFYLILSSVLSVTAALAAKPITDNEIPDTLKPWAGWVLHGVDNRDCPFSYNNVQQRLCAWPTWLQLNIENTSGYFEQQWQVFQESWILLPGSVKHWPQSVTVNNKKALVAERHGKPQIQLAPGHYKIKGEFVWDEQPKSLAIAKNTALIDLTLNQQKISDPNIDSAGQLWISKTDLEETGESQKGDHLEIQVYRKLIDDIPFTVVTRLDINVSGNQREVLLGQALLDDAIPLQLISQLPARLEPDGQLRMQVRPGRWSVELTVRYVNTLNEITLRATLPPWPESEIWVFDARNHLRLVEISGVPAIDTLQTNLPLSWKSLPAYQLKSQDTLELNEIRRGDPDPEPDTLQLRRQLWLDFDGGGYTLKDDITGTMTRGWRLEAIPSLELGRIVVDGDAQFITQLPGSNNKGVEVRQGLINVSADSRYEKSIAKLPVVGWQQDFQTIDTTLQLPPGWRLFAVNGVDNNPNTWLQSWTLLDLFLVLILALAVYRLWGVLWGLVALIAFVLIWQEPLDAPRYIWIHVFIAIALVRVVPDNWVRYVIVSYRNLSILALLVISVPFMVDAVRTGIYPQLERPWKIFNNDTLLRLDQAELMSGVAAESDAAVSSLAPPSMLAKHKLSVVTAEKELQSIDPNAIVQTGPGLPSWQWNSVHLRWNGPSDQQQTIDFLYMSPNVNMAVKFLAVLFLALMCLLVMGVIAKPSQKTKQTAKKALLGILPLFFIMPVLSLVSQPVSADFPPTGLLKELKNRLTVLPECLPTCAQSPSMSVKILNEKLDITVDVHAQQLIAMPLPAQEQQWLPSQVMVNGKSARSLMRVENGELWITLAKGIHRIQLSGVVPNRSYFQLPLAFSPRRVTVEAKGWGIDGIRKNGVPERQIQLTRVEKQSIAEAKELQTGPLPSFVRIERMLYLGLDWRVHTTVTRVSSTDTPVVLAVPLIQGESVTSESIEVREGNALVNLPPQRRSISWVSSLAKQRSIRLVATRTSDWVEVWRADVSPLWHVTFSGIPVIHHQGMGNKWLPEWRPLPGEEVNISTLRPEGVIGRTLTIDRSQLVIKPGKRATETTLNFHLRSSQGLQHSIVLPPGAILEAVEIDNILQPIRQDGRRVTLPVKPGEQQYSLRWRLPTGLVNYYTTQAVDLGLDSVNSAVQVQLGQDRWVLLTAGPRLGPAVLFWGIVLVIIFAAFVLSRSKLTPLRSWSWALLGIGLSQVHIILAIVVIGWLLALGAKQNIAKKMKDYAFNTFQIVVVILTVVSIFILFYAIQQGLLGQPHMQIAGNGSTATELNWYQDHVDEVLPKVWVFSVPIMIYRLLMLLWALWLAYSLLVWLRWGWGRFMAGGAWRKIKRREKKFENDSTRYENKPLAASDSTAKPPTQD
ncbi:MAG: hypothetical protein GXP08_09835 [Gammaproteobacteria bacterium]|nr:hypothetical protein [Gammaproteobacteria bacterium]